MVSDLSKGKFLKIFIDKGTKQFLNNLLKTQVAKIIKKITYYEFLFKRSMESKIFEDEVL